MPAADDRSVDNASDLRVLLGSAYPLVLAEVRDEERFLDLLRAEAGIAGLPVWVWSATAGLARDGMDPQYATQDLRAALGFVGELEAAGVFVFADAHPALADPLAVRAVKEAAQRIRAGQTIVLTAPHHSVPEELEEVAIAWSLRPPSDASSTVWSSGQSGAWDRFDSTRPTAAPWWRLSAD